ncbi:hypothetical protein Tco_0394083 [Tanacetum coccineum]
MKKNYSQCLETASGLTPDGDASPAIVFESDVKGSTASSSSTQNVAFVSSESTSSTNDVSTAYEEMVFGMANVAMISMRLKKFYKNTGRKLQSKGNQESRRRDAGNTGYKAKDNGRRPRKQEEPKALVTLDGDGVDWTGHVEDKQENFSLMAYNNSGSNTEVISCSKECEESYAKLKKLYDEQREQLGDASIEIQAYTQALKKISAKDKSGLGYGDQIHKGVLSYENEVLESVFDSRVFKNSLKLVSAALLKYSDSVSCEIKLMIRQKMHFKNKGIVDSGCSRHMTGNKAYLVEYQDYNGGPVAFGGSKGQITGKGKGPNWLFDLDYLTDSMNYQPVTAKNKANKTAGPKEANHSAGTQDNIDAGNFEMEAEPAQEYFELERLIRQEMEANDCSKAFRKEFAQCIKDLLLQIGAARATSTNTVNTVSTPISTASLLRIFSTSGSNLTNNDQDDSQIPTLEDIYDNPSDGIFTNASYDDEGYQLADFTS